MYSQSVVVGHQASVIIAGRLSQSIMLYLRFCYLTGEGDMKAPLLS
jgi:hypothetical protein